MKFLTLRSIVKTLAIVIIITLIIWIATSDSELSEKPISSPSPQSALLPGTSVISICARVSIQTLNDVANKLQPTVSVSGSQPINIDKTVIQTVVDTIIDKTVPVVGQLAKDIVHTVTRNIPTVVQAHVGDLSYNVLISRHNISVAPQQDGSFLVDVPFDANGQVGVKGDIAQSVGANQKDVYGSGVIHVSVRPRLNPDWTVSLDFASVNFSWTRDPTIEFVGNPTTVTADVKSWVQASLDGQVGAFVSKVQSQIDPRIIKRQVEARYGSMSFPFTCAGQTLYMNANPKSVGFSGLSLDQGNIKACLNVSVAAEVAATPIAKTPLPLPTLVAIGPDSDITDISVPIELPFSRLAIILRDALRGKQFVEITKIGNVSVQVDDVDMFPTLAHKAAIGVHIDAHLPGHLLNTRGWVYIIGTPHLIDGTITISSVTFSRSLNNSFWNIASTILKGPICGYIESKASYDTKADIQGLIKAVPATLQSLAGNDVKISISDAKVTLGDVIMSGDLIEVPARLQAKTSVAF